jgi:hypothetical protein
LIFRSSATSEIVNSLRSDRRCTAPLIFAASDDERTRPLLRRAQGAIESLKMTGEVREFHRAHDGAMRLERITPNTSAASKKRRSA